MIEEENMCIRDTGRASQCIRAAAALAWSPAVRVMSCQLRRPLRRSRKGNCIHRRRGSVSTTIDRPTGRYLGRSSHPPSVTSLLFSATLALPLQFRPHLHRPSPSTSVLSPSLLSATIFFPSSAFHLNANGLVISRFDIGSSLLYSC